MPSARATKYGVPPTAPNARTGESTPPGITSLAREKRPALSAKQALGQLAREVGEDDVRAGPLDRGDVLHGDRGTVDPAPLGRRLHHRVLAGHVVRRDGKVDRCPYLGDDVEVRERRLHHHDVGTLLDV